MDILLKEVKEEYAKKCGWNDFKGMVTVKGFTVEDSDNILKMYAEKQEIENIQPLLVERLDKVIVGWLKSENENATYLSYLIIKEFKAFTRDKNLSEAFHQMTVK